MDGVFADNAQCRLVGRGLQVLKLEEINSYKNVYSRFLG
jgi:hypothetical protein